uniref:beta-N-acetylhexosaminidase n=1 Tax=mine drainage metagenome TaxID=410659 RepID=E6QM99_9ZZZZ
MTATTLRHAVGSLLVVGLSSTELSGVERAWLRLIRPAGIILFRRNIFDAAQTRVLFDEAMQLCASSSLRCVDLEGGTVDRLRDVLTSMPSAQSVAVLQDDAMAQRHGELVASAVTAFGFNTTLAPVLDLALPASQTVLGTRAVSSQPEAVTAYARAFLRGLKMYGVVGCGKHFPGLGAGALDSHLETPSINRSIALMMREDLAPYRDLIDELPMVMVNHAAYPRTAGRETPASASRYWIHFILKKRLGYRGLIFSDDMEMGGILKYFSIEEAAITALRAGIHLMEICHSPELILQCYEAILYEAERSVSFRRLVLERARLVEQLREERFQGVVSVAFSSGDITLLRETILRFGEEVQKRAEQ